jgi:hypothetical protein
MADRYMCLGEEVEWIKGVFSLALCLVHQAHFIFPIPESNQPKPDACAAPLRNAEEDGLCPFLLSLRCQNRAR